MYYDKATGPPKVIYAFENGRIRAIVSPVYQRRGSGYVRIRSKTTVFSEGGRPIGQVNQTVRRFAAAENSGLASVIRASRLLAAAASDVLLPREAYAAQPVGECDTEFTSLMIALTQLAAATSALQLTGTTCLGLLLTAPPLATAACSGSGALLMAWLSAVDKWNIALDKYKECMDKHEGDPGGDQYGGDNAQSRFNDAVQQFIDNAVATGNYWCDSSGNHCIYYV